MRDDEAAIRSRATMYDVPRFAEAHKYRAIVVENVPEVRWWGPENARGAAFDSWISQVRAWGYDHQEVYLDGVHAQALGPGSRSHRRRVYIVFWRIGERRSDFEKWMRPYGLCPIHGPVQLVQSWKTTKTCSPQRPWGVYGVRYGQYVFRCPRTDRHDRKDSIIEPTVRTAAEAIDWDQTMPALYDRPTPLEPTTLEKLRAGWERHQQRLWRAEPEPIRDAIPSWAPTDAASYELLPYYGNAKTVPITRPSPTITTVDTLGLVKYGPTFAESRYRMTSVRENADLLEFPTGYRWLGNRSQNIAMIGNAVTPPAARDIAGLITEAITGIELDRYTLAA